VDLIPNERGPRVLLTKEMTHAQV